VYSTPEPLANAPWLLTVVLPLGLWCVWWLCCTDWPKLWPVLARGAWAAVVLFVLMGGVVWGRLDPDGFGAPGYALAAHVAAAAGLAGLAFFCGWLQGLLGWTPPEFPVHPPAAAHDHGHAHAHH
jgi:hypothetical protein